MSTRVNTIRKAVIFEQELFAEQQHPFQFSKAWKNIFPTAPGIYAIYDQNELVYIGETSNLKKRMSEVHRTYNHTFRKKLGLQLFGSRPNGNKYSNARETRLNRYYTDNLTFRFLPLWLGRLELETVLISRNQVGLLNSINRRSLLT